MSKDEETRGTNEPEKGRDRSSNVKERNTCKGPGAGDHLEFYRQKRCSSDMLTNDEKTSIQVLLSNGMFSDLDRVSAELVNESEASNKEEEGKDQEEVGEKGVDG